MRLLERYLLAELCKAFTVLLIVTTCLLMFVGVFGQMRENGLSVVQALCILPFIIPSLLPFTIPATMLLTVCVVYGRMSGDHEVIAAKAAGINVMVLLWPSLFLGAALSVICLLLLDQIIPWSFSHIEMQVALEAENIFLERLKTENQFHLKERGITITVLGLRDRTLIHPTIRYAPKGRKAVTIQAREARIGFDLRRQEAHLDLQNCHVDVDGRVPMYIEEGRQTIPLPGKNQRIRPQRIRIRDIYGEIAGAERRTVEVQQRQALDAAFTLSSGDFSRFCSPAFRTHWLDRAFAVDDFRRLQTELHNRFATACSCFFFVLVGSPFAILMAKKQFLTSFLFCFVPILVIYYPISIMTVNMSKSGQADPLWTVWCANAVLLAASGVVFRKVLQH